MNPSPKISVLLPTYNADRFLAAAINSILDQTEQNFELIIIDDHSTDTTAELLAQLEDPRILVLRNEQKSGVAASLNKGLQSARGIYVARMDADDLSHPDRLLQQASFLDAHPGVVAIDTLQQLINEQGEPTGQTNYAITGAGNIRKKMPWVNCLGHPSIMIRRKALMQYPYRTVVYEDLDLWLRLFNDGHLIDKLPQSFFFYRKHEKSVIQAAIKTNSHFRFLAATKWFYWKQLPLTQKITSFNLCVAAGMAKDALTWAFKAIKKRQFLIGL